MKRSMLAVAVLLLSTACATMPANAGKALAIACQGCAVLQSTGACVNQPPPTESGGTVQVPTCEAGKEPWVVNFDAVIDKKEAPKIECR